MNDSITAIPGILVGHAQHESALTGCSVVLCRAGAIGGVDVRGGAPGTRETALLGPMNLVDRVHAVLLAGGSAFGLEAAGGVMRYLEEQRIGYPVGSAVVPIVPGAVLFDLGIGRADIRPDGAMGYDACLTASDAPVREGNAGAGMGATVGKMMGMDRAVKAGIGSALFDLGDGLLVGALIAVNAVGDVVDPISGMTLAGPRGEGRGHFLNSLDIMKDAVHLSPPQGAGANTVIGVVATSAALSKSAANKIAGMAHNGLAKTIRPAHTLMDGDTIFSLATGTFKTEESPMLVSTIGAFAAEAVAQAVVRAVQAAESAGGLPAVVDMQ